ncbi:FAD-binding oxidoreductase [Sphingomonas canadensis]|uniref:FAD-binding oxidoreductase n=1 Tax=Sphingomonas canadensis TaxID=1219257 RepID=A0ABW3H8L6_9SPHN|nr:FAD-binding oxidoreductase [Sphingomonas canadensis]MCW3834436.1 FAD-binding oxidoreductase [Sphingomonas canadensis]
MESEGARADGISAEALDRAERRFAALLGTDAVRREGALFAEFHDPFEGPDARAHRPGLVIQPESVEQVQAAVRLAGVLGIPLWTSSMGRNFGYGGSAPVVDGTVVLNLRRMNRILEIDARQGFARIEPGVTFHQLYAALREADAPLMMSVPDLGWGSIIGNALEHGYGYNLLGDHASALCGLEVVLADGTLLRTGQGAIANSPLWSCHRRGFGPALDDLFKQSNMGIVTQAGLWLVPRPERIETGTILCRGEGDIVPLVDTLRSLVQSGVLQGIPMIVGTPDPAADEDSAAGGFTMAGLRKVLRPGRWNARIGLYGHAEMVAARRSLLERAVAAIPGAELELRSYPGDAGPETVEPRDLIAAGIPNQVLLERLKAAFGETMGHMDFSPVLPATGEAAQRLDAMVRGTLAKYGLVAPVGLLLNARSMVSACMVVFDAADAERVQAARDAVREMYAQAAGWGCAPYRAHVALVDGVAGTFGFNDHAMRRTLGRIKDALDPAGILSPGNHGIWPGVARAGRA